MTTPQKKIRVVRVPCVPNGAPEEVRRSWVGCEFNPLPESTPGVHSGLFGGPSKDVIGYKVRKSEAFSVLKGKDKKAWQWCKQNGFVSLGVVMVFEKEVCEVVE